jgi:hypothetical protein
VANHLLFRCFDSTFKRDASGIPQQVLDELSSTRIAFPYTFRVKNGRDKSSSTGSYELIVRALELNDIEKITNMCLAEYGGNTTFPSNNVSIDSVIDWLDNVMLRPLVDVTFRMKVQGCNPQDHAVLVLADSTDTLLAMIEVSQQPVVPDRNPPPYPTPITLKRVECVLRSIGLPQGWITNLLVAPKERGKGYGKLLIAACEGLALTSWGCSSMHLHCDADHVTGMVAQKLYTSLGYEAMAERCASDLAWMGPMTIRSSVYIIEGIPLLYLTKRLK